MAHLVEVGMSSGLDLSEAVRQSFLKLSGQNAVVVIDNSAAKNSNQVGKIIAVRSGSPLVLGLGKKEAFVASDASALLPHTREVYFLADGELAEISLTGFRVSLVKTGQQKNFQTQQLKTNSDSVKLGKFQHFLQKEIYQQPKVLHQLLKFEVDKQTSFTKFGQLIKTADQVWLVGCGSAGFAAMAGVEFLAKLAKKSATAVTASEFSSKLNLLTERSLVVGVSQSGETMDVLNALKAARGMGANIAALVNTAGSSLERLVQVSVLLEVGPELAVATTKAFTSKLGHFLLLAAQLAGRLESNKDLIIQAEKAVTKVLQPKIYGQIQKLALSLQAEQNAFILGKGVGVAAAAEFALKLKETAYIHAEGLAAGELKHGSLALIEKGTPCIILITELEHQQALLSAAMELKARGARVIGIGPKAQIEFDDFIQTPDCSLANLIPQVIVGQILGYELALLKGIDPDKPRNLAKSVTVI